MNNEFIWEIERQKEEEKFKKQQRQKKEEYLNHKKEIKRKKKKKRNRKIKLFIFLIILIGIFFYPYIPIKSVNIKNNFNISKKMITEDLGLKNKESISSLFFKKVKISKNKNYKNIKYKYEFKTKVMNVSVNESKPISHTTNINYIATSKGIEESEIEIDTPLLVGFDSNKINTINEELDKLDYSIISMIDKISYYSKKDDILKFNMEDENDVFIFTSQIGDKMKYYDQIHEIINKNGDGPGNIYLYIGDYYEKK